MLIASIILGSLIGLGAILQIFAASSYIRRFRRYPDSSVDDSQLPKAAIVICLRGADPFLGECLDRLTTQDYPSYKVNVIIDHPTDPARTVVEEWMSTHADRSISMSFLKEICNEACLKMSAIRQSIQDLDPSIGAAVMADADTIVYRGWLRDLITPMVATEVGVVSGNRWYDPTRRSWGSLARYVYNACSIVPMYLMRATWGGSLAMRREVFEQPYFQERMQQTACEDHAIQDAAHRVGLRVEVHPNVIILNREECSLRTCFEFVRRQLIWTRLYHPNWNQIVVGTLAANLVLAGGAVVAIVAAAAGEYRAAILLGGALLVELIIAQCMIEWLHRIIARRTERVQSESFPRVTWRSRLRLLVALPVTLVLFTLAVISAVFSRHVRWRAITYRIVPPHGIHIIEYRPYAEAETTTADRVSLS